MSNAPVSNSTESADSSKHLYEVQVGYAERGLKEQQIGSWRGVASSDVEAQNAALAACWDSRLDAAGVSPVFGLVVLPRYVVAENWHFFNAGQPRLTRWTYDRVEEMLLVAQAHDSTSDTWVSLDDDVRQRLQGDIHETDADGTPSEYELEETDVLPAWSEDGSVHVGADMKPPSKRKLGL